MEDKNYCMSSYLTFRYVEDPNKQFKEGLHHTLDMPYPEEKKVLVRTAADIAKAYKEMGIENSNFVFRGCCYKCYCHQRCKWIYCRK